MPEASGVGHDNGGQGWSEQNVTQGGTSFGGGASFLNEAWEEYNSGTYTGISYWTNSDGTATPSGPYAGVIPPLAVVKEYRDQEDQQHPPATTFWEVDHYESIEHHSGDKEKRETLWLLRTGGKGLIGHKNLWRIWGSASDCSDQAIPNSQIEIIQGKKLYPDGSRWIALQDGTEFDVTPRVAGRDCYRYDVGATKYPMTIRAGCSRLTADLDNEKPKFCVGESVAFVPNWRSGTPPYDEPTSTFFWHLPAKFVNEPYAYSPNCNSFRRNAALLNNRAVQCWYVNTPGGACSMRATLHFANGQYVTVAAAGSFTIDRPASAMVPFSSAESYRQFFITGYGPGLACKLKYGTDDDQALGQMQYRVKVTSDYDGDAGFTQICDLDYSNPAAWCTGNLDGSTEFYHGTVAVRKALNQNPLGNIVPFFDSPSSIWISANRLKGSFRDYVRFRPTGNNNIYVTLGIVTWDMHAVAEQFFTLWQLTKDSHPAPVGPDVSDAFPEWTKVHQE